MWPIRLINTLADSELFKNTYFSLAQYYVAIGPCYPARWLLPADPADPAVQHWLEHTENIHINNALKA